MEWLQLQRAIEAEMPVEGNGFRIFGGSNVVTAQNLWEGWWQSFPACQLRSSATGNRCSPYLCNGRSEVLADPQIALALDGRLAAGPGPLAAGELAAALASGSYAHPPFSHMIPTPPGLRASFERVSRYTVTDATLEDILLVLTAVINEGQSVPKTQEVIERILQSGATREEAANARLGRRAAYRDVFARLGALGLSQCEATDAITTAMTKPKGAPALGLDCTRSGDYLWPCYYPFLWDCPLASVVVPAGAFAPQPSATACKPGACPCKPSP